MCVRLWCHLSVCVWLWCPRGPLPRATRGLPAPAPHQNSNAALESPTGTGKTLCLLCASLAWQAHKKKEVAQLKQHHGQMAKTEPKLKAAMANRGTGWDTMADDTGKSPVVQAVVPKILFASRTHTQLSQTIKELKATKYAPSVCTLASREQLCINPRVQELESNALKTASCQQKVKARQRFN